MARRAAAKTLGQKLQPSLIDGFGVRAHGGLSVAAPTAQVPPQAIYVLTHVDVFPAGKDQAVELVKAQADAARKDDGNLSVRRAAMGRAPQPFHVWSRRGATAKPSMRAPRRRTPRSSGKS